MVGNSRDYYRNGRLWAHSVTSRGKKKKKIRRGKICILAHARNVRVSLVLFNRLPLHFCSGREWEQRTIIGGGDFALNMLSVVCKFTRTLRRCNLQVKQPTTLRPITVAEVCTTFSRGAWERERENPAFKSKKKTTTHFLCKCNQIAWSAACHRPCNSQSTATPESSRLSSHGLASQYLS